MFPAKGRPVEKAEMGTFEDRGLVGEKNEAPGPARAGQAGRSICGSGEKGKENKGGESGLRNRSREGEPRCGRRSMARRSGNPFIRVFKKKDGKNHRKKTTLGGESGGLFLGVFFKEGGNSWKPGEEGLKRGRGYHPLAVA